MSFGLILLGSGGALVLVDTARFMVIATGGMEAGLAHIPLSLDHAERTRASRRVDIVTAALDLSAK